MSDYGKEFFEGKRPWSKIKDSILASYMTPYLTKVNQLGKQIILIDGFAGPGTFGEKRNPGSPLIIEQAANRIVPNTHKSYFINNNRKHHQQLDAIREKQKWTNAEAVFGNANETIPQILQSLTDEVLFLYLDPFGLKDAPFSIIEPILHRTASTEILIVMHASALHRLAARNAVERGEIDQNISRNHQILSDTLGGDYWKEALLDPAPDRTASKREEIVLEGYCKRLKQGNLKCTGFCPVQTTTDRKTKYYVVFATGSDDGLEIMNDNMLSSFERHMTKEEMGDSFFAEQDWIFWRDNAPELEALVLSVIADAPGLSRISYWHKILETHFFRFMQKEYNAAVKRLLNDGVIRFEPVGSKRYNKLALLFPANSQQLLL